MQVVALECMDSILLNFLVRYWTAYYRYNVSSDVHNHCIYCSDAQFHNVTFLHRCWIVNKCFESKMTWVYFPVSWLSGLEIKAWAVCNSTELLLLPTCIVDVPTSLDLSWEVSDLLSEADSVPELSTRLDRLLRIFTDGHVMSSSTIKTLGLWLTTWRNMPCFQANKIPTTSSQYSSSSHWFSNGTTGHRLDFSCKRHNAEYNLHCLHKVRMRKGAVWIFPYAGQILG